MRSANSFTFLTVCPNLNLLFKAQIYGVLAMFTFQLGNTKGKHCWYPIAVMGVVDTFGRRHQSGSFFDGMWPSLFLATFSVCLRSAKLRSPNWILCTMYLMFLPCQEFLSFYLDHNQTYNMNSSKSIDRIMDFFLFKFIKRQFFSLSKITSGFS